MEVPETLEEKIERLHKLHNEKAIHRRLIDYIALQIGILLNKRNFDISEYKVQGFISDFLIECFQNTDTKVLQERQGKCDCTVSIPKKKESKRKLKEGQKPKFDYTPILLFELKTYLKPGEDFNNENIANDICDDLYKLTKKVRPTIKCYFVFAAKNGLFTGKRISQVSFIYDRFSRSMKKIPPFFWPNNDGKEVKDPREIRKIILRPSNKMSVSGITVMSWEILPEKPDKPTDKVE